MEEVRIYTKRWAHDGAVRIIKIEGFLDTTTSQSLAKKLDEMLDQEVYRIVIDLEAVDYISSPGWGILVGDIRRIREGGGDLKLARMKPEVFEIYALLGLDSFIESYSSVEEACSQFAQLPLAIEQPIEPESLIEESQEPAVPFADTKTVVEEKKEKEGAGEKEKKKVEATKVPREEEVHTLSQMVREIVEEHPDYNTWKIKKELDSEKYGYTKASWFKVYREIRHLRRGFLATEQRRLEIQEKRLREMRDDFGVERRLWEAERRIKLQKDELERERRELEAMKRELERERQMFRQEVQKRGTSSGRAMGVDQARRAKWMDEILRIVRRHPEYGAKRISDVLEVEHSISRSVSTIYSKLRRADLNTKEKRIEFLEGERGNAGIQS